MKINKLSIGVLFLLGSTTMLLAQQKSDTIKSTKNIEGVIIQGSTKKGKESNLINLQRKSVEVIERVGSVQLEKQGVGDVATAVTKATGTQKQEGSGQIFVRGLGDRYNGTTLNGLEIPSDNPEFKNINLEIFKTSMIEYLSLDKVYNPRFSGDFGGANIDIVSKTHVGKPYFKVGLGSSINLQTFDKANFKMQDGGPGFFGFNEATYRTGSPYDKYPFTTKWNFKNAQNPFNTSMDFEGGARLGKFMLFGYAGFDNSYEYSTGKEGFYFANGDANKDYNVEKSDYKTNTTTLLNVDYKINANNKLKLTTNYIHSSQQEAKIYKGYSYDVDRNVIINRGDNKLTDTWINQLFGNHNISNSWTLDWALAFNLMNSKRPDRMQNTINAETNEFLASSAISNHRYFDELKDKTYLGHLYLTKKFNQNYKLVVGYDGSYKDRQFNQTTLGMNFTTSVPVNYQDIDAFINAFNNSFFIYNIQKSNYSIKRNIQSGFANFDMNLSDKFTLQIGGRYDYIDFDMAWKDILDDSTRKKQYNKFLPALNAKYSINDRQNLRLSASQTYTLPQPKELIPIAYYDVTANVYGNPYLYPSDNYNADLKWEFFPKTGEIISLTAFGKYIQNPIGRSTYSSASPSDMTFFNIANWGYIYGAEAEIRKDIFSWDKSKIYAFVNGTFMQSKQELKNETELAKENNGKTAQFSKLENDVQGVAKFLANANVGYNYKWGGNNTVDLVVSYSRVGKNLYSIGTNKVGDFYELAKDILDVNINFSMKQIGIGISGKNLLNPHSKIEQINDSGTFIHKDYTRGRQVGLSLTYKFSK